LTHPSLIPTFQEEILETLIRHAKNDDLSLLLAYYHSVQPTLQSSSALENLFSAIARTSVTEAYYFCQGQTDVVHRQMFEALIVIVLRGTPNENTAARAIELVGLPFTPEEEGLFETYLSSGSGRALSRAKDTVMMRRITTGRFEQALSADEFSAKEIRGLSWENVQKNLLQDLGPRAGTNGVH
jgi:hypothetical protein